MISIYFKNLNVRLQQENILRLKAEHHLKASNQKLEIASTIREEANIPLLVHCRYQPRSSSPALFDH